MNRWTPALIAGLLAVTSACDGGDDPAVGTAAAETAFVETSHLVSQVLGTPATDRREDVGNRCQGALGPSDDTSLQLWATWIVDDPQDPRIDLAFSAVVDYLESRSDVQEVSDSAADTSLLNMRQIVAEGDFDSYGLVGPTSDAETFQVELFVAGPCR